MKKYVSILMVIALVFSLAAVLSACKDDDKGDTATTPTESSSLENNNDDPFFWPTYDQTTDESGSLGSEQPVNAHPYYSTTSRPYYSSESTTSKIGAVTMQTTRAGETTTGRVGSVIVPGTTAPGGWTNPDGTPNPNNPTAPGSTATTKPGETTTAPIIDLNQYENGEVVRPATTQYERYVRNVIASGSYTMKVTASEGGETINMINYHSGMNDEIMAVASMGILQVKLRLIVKNGDYYIVFPTNEYAKFSSSGTNAISGLGDIGEVGKLIADNIGDIFYNPEESLKYDGLISQAGQYCESYVDENGNKVNFYFNNGLQKIEFVDSSGKRVTQNVSLVAGTKKQSVSMFDSIFGAQPFEIPRTATEIKDESKLQSLLGGMGFPIDDMFN